MASAQNIPLSLNLLREALEDFGYNPHAIAEYSFASRNTNFVVPYHCLLMDGDESSFDSAALEESLHAMLDHGFTDDDVRVIMGLVRVEDVEPDGDPDDFYLDDHYIEIDLGWLLPLDVQEPQTIPSGECRGAFPEHVTGKQVEQVTLAVNEYGVGIHGAMRLVEHEYTDWQAHQICIAVRDGVDALAVDALADPRFNHAQMRELRRMALDCPSYPDRPLDGLNPHLAACLNPSFSPEKLYRLRRLGEQLASPHSGYRFSWDGLPAFVLDEAQLADVSWAVEKGIPTEVIKEYATGEYPAEHMAAVTTALAMGCEEATVARLLDTSYSSEQVRYLSYVMGHANLLGDGKLDLLCDPGMSVKTMKGAFYGFFHRHLDVSQVAPVADGSFTTAQMEVVFDAVHYLERAGLPAGAAEQAVSLLSDPSLTTKQMQRLMVQAEEGRPIGELKELKESFAARNKVKKGTPAAEKGVLSGLAAETRDAADRLGEAARGGTRPAAQQEKD